MIPLIFAIFTNLVKTPPQKYLPPRVKYRMGNFSRRVAGSVKGNSKALSIP